MALDFPGSPSNGQSYKGFVYDSTAGVWRVRGESPIGFASVSATTGSPTEGSRTIDGTDYNVYVFTGSGSITFDNPGFARILAVGGGGGGVGYNSSKAAAGGGGGVRWGSFEVSATTYTVEVGAGGAAAGNNQAGTGGDSAVTGILVSSGARGGNHLNTFVSHAYPGFGGNGGSNGRSNGDGLALGGGAGGLAYGSVVAGITFDWSGSSVEYGLGQQTSLNSTRAGTANTGEAGRYVGNGGSGVVIVMVRA